MALIEPTEITLTDGSKKERKFILSKMPAFEGMEIMARYPTSLAMGVIPKIGDWQVVREMQLMIMKYVAVDIGNGIQQPLLTQALIDNHTGDWECLAKLLKAEVAYNNSFFRDGTISSFLNEAFQIAVAKISEILTQSSVPSSPTEKQPSTS